MLSLCCVVPVATRAPVIVQPVRKPEVFQVGVEVQVRTSKERKSCDTFSTVVKLSLLALKDLRKAKRDSGRSLARLRAFRKFPAPNLVLH